MQSTQTPTLVPLAFAANGTKNVIPEASQIGITNGAASLNDGFPLLTMIPIAAGGVPPNGADMNGILNLLSQSARWQHAGGHYAWNSAFASDINVGGYPAGAMLLRADLTGFWLNTSDNNATNPDATDGSAANWVPGYNYGVTTIAGLTNANVTLTTAQAAKSKIVLSGVLTGNVQIIFPTWLKNWDIVNNTTGNFSVTCKTAAGTGIVVSQGSLSRVAGDGTNVTQLNEQVPTATLPQHGVPLAQVQSLRGSFNGSYSFSTSTTLTTGYAGALISFTGTAPQTFTIPQATTMPSSNAGGSGFVFVNDGTAPLTISRSGSDTFLIANLTNVISIVLQPGDDLTVTTTPASGTQWFVYGSAMRAFTPLSVGNGTVAVHAVTFSQLTGIVGSARNVSATLSAPATSITFTADELVAETALGGLQFKAANFSQTLNLATTGIGGMDTGTAPISGFVGIYAAYNPTTQAWGVFGTNATAAAVANVYGGANRPAGYTVTMLISVWPTNGSGQLIIATQQDRKISFAPITIISTSTQQAAYALFNAAPAVPKNAKTCRPSVNINSSLASATLSTQVAASAAGVGEYTLTTVSVINNSGQATPLQHVPLITQQGLYYIATVTSGTMSFALTICEYTF